MTNTRHFSVHGHFYQPMREDPMTGEIPIEPGAHPWPNWNERIYQDCYLPNVEAGNFERISFNLGPTLSSWMRKYHPDTLNKIDQADKLNVQRFGVGNAIAQPYHHTILPLMNRRDKTTQVLWGISEFENTFGRKASGMWLPETAVDMETLQVLAENGIEFTLLAPWQANQVDIDVSQAYQVVLAEHKTIKVIFYNSRLSSSLSFDNSATQNADDFTRHLLKSEFTKQAADQWITVATDGELYGHHQSFRDKFLSYLLDGSIASLRIEMTFPSLQLMRQKVFPLVSIRDNTSWSCHHGIQRWKGQCDCTVHADWKKPLRQALEWLTLQVDQIFFERMKPYFTDPWQARNRFYQVFSGVISFAEWVNATATRVPDVAMMDKLEKIFLAEYNCQRMFTSCAWFFDDLDRVEPRYAVACAAYALCLVKLASGIDLAMQLSSLLEKSRSFQSGLTAADFFADSMRRCPQSCNEDVQQKSL